MSILLRFLPFLVVTSFLMVARAHADPVIVDISEFRAENVLRGERAAEYDIRTGTLAFYVGTCAFPGISATDHRKLALQKQALRNAGVTPREYDRCDDVVSEAKRTAAFVEGYNSVIRIEMKRRLGRAFPF